VSQLYTKILHAIRTSAYYTTSAADACVFVLAYDTLDRDRLSTDYVSTLKVG
jgi:glucuronyl/N-acetylglucosaminyl transferase EXT1